MITPTSSTSTSTAATTASNLTLGKNDFLKLLTTQLQNQDPLNPTDESQMIGTLAQFSSLEQMTNLNSGVTQLTAVQQWGQATSMIGHQVIATDAQGNTIQGAVQNVVNQSGTPLLTVNGTLVNPSTVQQVS